MQDDKCSKTVCFANGCDGFCKLEHLYQAFPYLIAECDPRYTCKRAIELKISLMLDHIKWMEDSGRGL